MEEVSELPGPELILSHWAGEKSSRHKQAVGGEQAYRSCQGAFMGLRSAHALSVLGVPLLRTAYCGRAPGEVYHQMSSHIHTAAQP